MRGKRSRFGLSKVAIILIVTIIAVGALFFFKTQGFISKTEINADLIASRIASVKKLITTEYHYTNMGAMRNQNEFYGWKVPFTKKSFIISYEGVIYIGTDIEKAEIKIEEREIIIDLPDAEILSHEIKEDSITIFDEKTSIFNPIEIGDYTNFSADQKKVMEEKVIASEMLATATKNTQDAIAELLMLTPEISENYKIRFI